MLRWRPRTIGKIAMFTTPVVIIAVLIVFAAFVFTVAWVDYYTSHRLAVGRHPAGADKPQAEHEDPQQKRADRDALPQARHRRAAAGG